MSDSLEVIPQKTPNPNALKFTLNRNIATAGKTYQDANTADQDWAKEILTIPGVTLSACSNCQTLGLMQTSGSCRAGSVSISIG